MMFEELADGVRTINFKAIGRAAELLQQAKIMECSADKQKLYIEFFPCLPAKLICPEEDAVRVVEQQRRAELSEKAGRLASQLTIRDYILEGLKRRRRFWYRENYLGPRKRRHRLHRLTDGGCIGFHISPHIHSRHATESIIAKAYRMFTADSPQEKRPSHAEIFLVEKRQPECDCMDISART